MTYNTPSPILVVLSYLVSTSFSHAESNVRNETVGNTPLQERPDSSGAYVSGMLGPGDIRGVSGDHRLNFEVRFGSPLANERYPRLDIVHFNEGHAHKNHRDGFAVQASVGKQLGNSFRLELGAGPYLSMNTTSVSGIEYNKKRLGLLGSAAILYMIGDTGLHIRAGINGAYIAVGPNSYSYLFGLGQNFGALPSSSHSKYAPDPGWDIGVMAGVFKTNHGGVKHTEGYQVELTKRISPRWAWSLGWIEEGDDHVLVDRYGLTAKVWYIIPLNERWTTSVATGPYLAENRYQNNHTELNALITLRLARNLGDGWKVFVRFERIATSKRNRNSHLIHSDRDIGMFGFSKKLGH